MQILKIGGEAPYLETPNQLADIITLYTLEHHGATGCGVGVAGTTINLALGVLYTWSVLKGR
jgi:hypothetical protein